MVVNEVQVKSKQSLHYFKNGKDRLFYKTGDPYQFQYVSRYNELYRTKNLSGLILFIDFEKAFD